MKRTLIKIISVIMAFMMTVCCASVAFADSENYEYVCTKCGETVTVTNGIDTHNMFCEGNAHYCENCGEIIYGGTHVWIAHIASCKILNKYTAEIKNNPGSTTINYGETLKLTAVILFNGESADEELTAKNYKWTTDSGAVKLTPYGKTCEVEAVKAGTATVSFVIVDEDGNEMSEFSDSQTITVKAGFFEKLISFFKNLFGINRTIEQTIYFM